jgi:hypothetical protein
MENNISRETNEMLRMICQKFIIKYSKILCNKCAMKMATGKCTKCHELFTECRRIINQ